MLLELLLDPRVGGRTCVMTVCVLLAVVYMSFFIYQEFTLQVDSVKSR